MVCRVHRQRCGRHHNSGIATDTGGTVSTVDSQQYASLGALLAPRLDGEDFTIEATGHVVRIRGLSRYETLLAQKHLATGQADFEARILHYALLEPTITVEQAYEWLRCSPAGELEMLTRRVQQLSGAGQGADVEASERFRPAPGARVRDHAGEDAGPDGGRAETDDLAG